MCEICDIKKRLQAIRSEFDLRVDMYVKERQFGSEIDAAKMKDRAFVLLKEMFDEYDKVKPAIERLENASTIAHLLEKMMADPSSGGEGSVH